MKITDRHLDLTPWILATVLVAAIVHLVSVLLMPHLAPKDALARLSQAAADSNAGLLLLSSAQPNAQVLPFQDPTLVEGVCFFDLSKGLLHLRGNVEPGEFLGVSFHGSAGRVFHAMTDRSAIKGKIDVVLGDASQISELESEDSDDAPPPEIRVTAPSAVGFVLIRSFIKRPSDRDRAEQQVRAIQCESFEPPAE
jgi:uncharacterized membrane protein